MKKEVNLYIREHIFYAFRAFSHKLFRVYKLYLFAGISKTFFTALLKVLTAS